MPHRDEDDEDAAHGVESEVIRELRLWIISRFIIIVEWSLSPSLSSPPGPISESS
jgi:hypothetical protein